MDRSSRHLLAGNLRDLARVNRWLGGSALSWSALSPLLQPESTDNPARCGNRSGRPAALPAGPGAGEPSATRSQGNRHPARDRSRRPAPRAERPLASKSALAARPVTGSTSRIDRGTSSIPRSCCTTWTRLQPSGCWREMARVARRAVIVNDLERGRVWWLGAWLLTRVATRNRYTRNDAPLSVRRAYRSTEMRALGRAAGLRMIARHKSFPGYRYALVFGKPDAMTADATDVAIVGGGPAGSALAIRLAQMGIRHAALRAPARNPSGARAGSSRRL